MIKICINDADIPVKPLYLSQDLHEKPLAKGRSIWMFLLIELIPWPVVTQNCTHLYTFVSSLSKIYAHKLKEVYLLRHGFSGDHPSAVQVR